MLPHSLVGQQFCTRPRCLLGVSPACPQVPARPAILSESGDLFRALVAGRTQPLAADVGPRSLAGCRPGATILSSVRLWPLPNLAIRSSRPMVPHPQAAARSWHRSWPVRDGAVRPQVSSGQASEPVPGATKAGRRRPRAPCHGGRAPPSQAVGQCLPASPEGSPDETRPTGILPFDQLGVD